MRQTHLLTATAAAAALLGVLAAPQLASAQTPAPAEAAQPAAPAETPAPAASSATPVVVNGDLVETIKASGQFTTFIKGLDAVNLTGLLKTQPGLTVFVPTDAAFAALPAGELDRLMADKAGLQKLLTHHVINASVDSSKITGKRGPVPSVATDSIELDGSEAGVLKADSATIVQADLRTPNGTILHVVDKVLIAGSAPPPPPEAEVPATDTSPIAEGTEPSA